MSATDQNINSVAKVGLYILAFAGLIALLRKVGIFESEKENTISSFEKNGSTNPFNYKLFKRPEKKTGKYEASLGATGVKNLSVEIFTLFDKYDVNENSVIAMFKKMATKSDLWFVNGYLIEKYKIDLWNKLKNALDDNELFEVVKFVQKLPSYTK